MAGNGSTTVDFGNFPGKGEAYVDVASQSGLVETSKVEAWLLPIATADPNGHSKDEHIMEKEFMDVIGYWKVDGTLTIKASARSVQQLRPINRNQKVASARLGGGNATADEQAQTNRLYGKYTMGWAWT